MSLAVEKLKDTARVSWKNRLLAGLAYPFLRQWKRHCDPACYNGATWLGVDGIAVKSHGGTNAWGFAHAVRHALEMIHAQVNDTLIAGVERLKGE